MGIILAYDCTNESSFANIRNWVQQIKLHATDSVARILIGNKCDLPDKRVTSEQGQALARELGIPFFETSAKSNINIHETFYQLAKQIKDNRMGEPMNAGVNLRVSTPGNTTKSSKKCC